MNIENYIDKLRDDGSITINLLCTMQCNFECDHCMYFCSPQRDSKYMSNSVLSDIKEQVNYLQSLDLSVSVNLIGGEPTLNFREFERILNEVTRWEVGIEMTTNGWFLKSAGSTRRFLEIVQPYIDNDGEGLGGYNNQHGLSFSVRISNDEYHTPFRKFNVESALKNIWESCSDDPVLYKETPICATCYEEITDWNEPTPCCDSYIEYDYEEYFNQRIPEPCDGDPWIYTESTKYNQGSSGVIAIGRARHWGRINHSYKNGCYYMTDKLTYTPKGVLTDFCCKGSWMERGTVKDNPIILLMLCSKFKKDNQDYLSCSECRSLCQEWTDDTQETSEWSKAYAKLYKKLEKFELIGV
jgi:hypothetical protein